MTSDTSKLQQIHIKNFEAALPMIKPIVLRTLRLLNDPDCFLSDILDCIKHDPVLGARIISVVNSPFYSGLKKVSDLESAVVRIGMNELEKIILSCYVNKVFSSGKNSDMRLLKLVWEKSLAQAFLAEKLAITHIHLFPLGAEQRKAVYMSALLDNIGYLFLASIDMEGNLSRILNQPHDSLQGLSDHEEEVFGASCFDIGSTILEMWHFPEFIVDCTRHLSTPPTEYSGPNHDLLCLLSLSRYLAHHTLTPVLPAVPAEAWKAGFPTRITREIDFEHITDGMAEKLEAFVTSLK
jgi:HD-like signal output (HDOD) protein